MKKWDCLNKPVEEYSNELILILAVSHDLDEAVIEPEMTRSWWKNRNKPDEWSGCRDKSRRQHAGEGALEQAKSLAEERVELLEVPAQDLLDHVLRADQGEVVEPAGEQLVRDLHLLVLHWYQGDLCERLFKYPT